MVSTRAVFALAASLGLVHSAALGRRAVGSSGCGKKIPRGHELGADLAVNITSGYVERSYRIYIPPTYSADDPSPVVISYHGGKRNATWQMELDGITEEPFFNRHYIVIHPDGLNMSWQGTPQKETGDDILFTNDFLDDIEDRYCVDTLRIFATGKSNGGGFVNLAACDRGLSTRIAAFAPVSGSFYVDGLTGSACDPESVKFPTCRPGRADVAVIEFHGGEDTTIPYTGNSTRKDSCLPDIRHWAAEWARRNGLPEADQAPRRSKLPGSRLAELYEWGTGRRRGLVSHVYDPGVAHSWPSTTPNLDTEFKGEPPASYNATHVMLDFFLRHPLAVSNLERRRRSLGGRLKRRWWEGVGYILGLSR